MIASSSFSFGVLNARQFSSITYVGLQMIKLDREKRKLLPFSKSIYTLKKDYVQQI